MNSTEYSYHLTLIGVTTFFFVSSLMYLSIYTKHKAIKYFTLCLGILALVIGITLMFKLNKRTVQGIDRSVFLREVVSFQMVCARGTVCNLYGLAKAGRIDVGPTRVRIRNSDGQEVWFCTSTSTLAQDQEIGACLWRIPPDTATGVYTATIEKRGGDGYREIEVSIMVTK
jgi:hypothetical protein